MTQSTLTPAHITILKRLVTNASQCTFYVASGTRMANELSRETGIPESDCRHIVDLMAIKLDDHMRDLLKAHQQ